jgi:hypothetical protein
MVRGQGLVGAVVVVTCLGLAGCATNPATGERQLSLVSESQEVQLGRQAAAQVERTLGFVEKPELAQFTSRFPSVVPLEQLATINQITDAAAPLPQGTLVKRVVS